MLEQFIDCFVHIMPVILQGPALKWYYYPHNDTNNMIVIRTIRGRLLPESIVCIFDANCSFMMKKTEMNREVSAKQRS